MDTIVEIEKLTSDGRGLAHFNDKVVFVDKTCPKDRCKIKIIKENKSYYVAELTEIVEKSPHRVKPFCPMYNVCGACGLQHIDYDYQLKLKKIIVEDSMRGVVDSSLVHDVIPSPKIKEFRHKIQYPIRETNVSKRILAGYFKPKSHDIVNIKYCPIQPEICDEIIEFIRENAPKYKINGYDEKNHRGLLRHVVIRSSSKTGEVLVVLVLNSDMVTERVKDFSQILYDKFDKIVGVTANLNTGKTNLIMTEKTISVIGKDYVEESLCGVNFKIGSNTFFQVNPKSAENIFSYIKDYIKQNFNLPAILDAYAGISVFGLIMSDISKSVVTVEENLESVKKAKEVKRENGFDNVELFCDDSEKFFETQIELNKKYDVIILDPPRKGCTEKTLNSALRLSNSHIIYVSCNPSTLARDLKYLINNGAKIESVQPFDMFCHTSHIENVAIIKLIK